MKDIFDIFKERGFIEQHTDEGELRELFKKPVTCYVGFDPTGKSLHIGHLLPVMALTHIQQAGHRPIAVVGGGTTLVGDPSGKTEMRPIMTREEIDNNAQSIKNQLMRFLDFENGRALMVNNADWLTKLNYIDFLRDIGRHFSVNRMLTAESYKMRMETGLSFIEFNYMLLQAYDFWHLFKHHDCRLQMGGSDQWGNIVAGTDLIRRLERDTAHCITFPLITTASGAKMGKTAKGAVWLDPEMTSPYEYYQYWINQEDTDIERFLMLFTFLPVDEVKRLSCLEGADIRIAKEILAFEATKICHGEAEAIKARNAAKELFGNGEQGISDSVPEYKINRATLEQGIPAFILFEQTTLSGTRSDARRLIMQGGGYINNEKIEAFDQIIDLKSAKDGIILLRAGKKRYMKVSVS
jgi:tyrosyl-tRNA synthetase